MTIPDGQPTGSDPVIEATLKAALEDLLGDSAPVATGATEAAHETPDVHWLGLGLRLGLERPDRARYLLELLEADTAAAAGVSAPSAGPGETDEIPVRSLLLVRSALTPPVSKTEMDAEPMFGWVSRLAPGEILAMGRAVERMVADGALVDVTRGFGIAWMAGAKIPLKSLDGMFGEFTQLQLVVAGALGGRDLAAIAREEPKGRGGLLRFRRSASPALHEADMILQQRGKSASLGLVTLWNAWTAVRYRERIPAATFDLLVQPWISVVGRLP